MSYWTIPNEMKIETPKKVHANKNVFLVNFFLPFALAVMSIPLYIMIIMKIIDMFG